MAVNEMVAVRCTPELIEGIDELKRDGESRPDFIRRCVARVIEGERLRRAGGTVLEGGFVKRDGSPSERYAYPWVKPADCVHPPNQRVGGTCMVCGKSKP